MQDRHHLYDVIEQYPLLTPEEEAKTCEEASNGNQAARDLLVLSNLRLVISIATRFMSRVSDKDSLISAGVEGLVRASKKYDLKLGKFSVYASRVIHGYIVKYFMKNTSIVTVTLYGTNKLWKSNKGIVDIIGDAAEKAVAASDVVNLDSPIDDKAEGGMTIGEAIKDENAESAADIISNEDEIVLARRVFHRIHNARHRTIVKLRFGLDDESGKGPMTLQQIGDIVGITRERCRQIVDEAVENMHRLDKEPKAKKRKKPLDIVDLMHEESV